MTRISVIYDSATGTVHRLAEALAEGAESTGAEVRLRRVRELAPAIIVPPGYTDEAVFAAGGNPYGTSALDGAAAIAAETLAAAAYQGRRLATVARRLVQRSAFTGGVPAPTEHV